MIVALAQLAQAQIPLPVEITHVSTELVYAAAAGTVLVLGALATAIVKVIQALGAIHETKALVQTTSDQIASTTSHVATIEKNTDGRLSLMADQVVALTAKLEDLGAARLVELTAERDALAARVAAGQIEIVKRADAAPAAGTDLQPRTDNGRRGDDKDKGTT